MQICKRSVEVMDAVRRGAQLAIDECQFQFRNRRWNCSTLETMPVFGKVVTQGKTTGTAFMPNPSRSLLNPLNWPRLCHRLPDITAANSNPKIPTTPFCWHLQSVESGASFLFFSSVGYFLLSPPRPDYHPFFILHELHRWQPCGNTED